MASGFAFPNSEDKLEVFKGPVAGSNLPLKTMPRNTKTAIFHTRYATQGSPSDNTNNHPVWSPHGTIALVHNGVIWNDYMVRMDHLMGIDLPVVDSSVIPALLEYKGIPGIAHLSGDAAVAWLDEAALDTLHLARIESSPVSYTNLEDGSFVFASTPTLLGAALDNMNLDYGQIFSMSELDYYQIKGGVIWHYSEVPEPEGFQMGYASRWRNQTSGGHSTTTVVGSEALSPAEESEKYDAIADQYTDEENAVSAWNETVRIGSEDRTIPMFKVGIDQAAEQYDGASTVDAANANFFTIDMDGAMEVYETLDELETRLLYLAGRTGDEGLGAGKEKWVNYFTDIGSFGFDHETLISWVEEPSEIAYHDDANTDGLGYIRDGVSLISSLAGR